MICGDSAEPKVVAAAMDGKQAGLVYTDPPYNVAVAPRTAQAIAAGSRGQGGLTKAQLRGSRKGPGKLRARDRAVENDTLPPAEFAVVLRAWFRNIGTALQPGRGFYIWGGYSNYAAFPAALEEAGLYFSQAIVWLKEWPVLTRKDFMGNHEWAFYGWKTGAAHYFTPEINNATDVWIAKPKPPKTDAAVRLVKDGAGWREFDPARDNVADVWAVRKIAPQKMIHLTQKPVELAERAMRYSSKRGERILDPFGGSGATMIAAERMERSCRMVEIDPAYCDVIIQRWQEFTGKTAKRRRAKR